MSKNKPKQSTQKPAVASPKPVADANKTIGIVIPYPFLWLALAVIAVYFPTFSFGFTQLDDSIFIIHDLRAYNQDLHNLIASFHRGLFIEAKDIYYRPLFMDSMILNYQLSDDGQNITAYHVVNVLFHAISVCLLYKVLRKLNIKELHSFILSLVFAVLPVLSQAVAWIPGRNDTMLAIFILSFLLYAVNYSNSGKTKDILLSALFLLLAFFTKETAVFAPPAAFILLVVVLNKKWLDKNSLIQYTVWGCCFLLWYLARAQADTKPSGIASAHALSDLAHRTPVIVQYLGKIFLPFNLSVFPEQQDTVYYYGVIAVIGLLAILYLNKQRNMRMVLGGALFFLLFLMPALLIPQEFNKQTFEHRLYLPVIGILMILSQTALLKNKLNDKQLLIGAVVVCVLLAVINFRHQKNFADPIAFWTQAIETSPNSAVANMKLAAMLDQNQMERSRALFRKAYRLDPKEKYINFYYGLMLQGEDSIQQSVPYLLAEKNRTGYYACDLYLARAASERNAPFLAITYLESYLKNDATHKLANTNLLALYINTQQRDKAVAQVKHMQLLGLEVPAEALRSLGI